MLMNYHESRTPGVLFSGSWRYKPSHGALGLLMSAGACILLGRMMLLFFQDEEIIPEKVQQAAGLCLAGCVLFYFGTTLFFSFFTGYNTRLIVSEDGVRYGSKFYDWRRLRWIDARLNNGSYQIHIERRRGLFRRKKLTIDGGLAEEQWERLLKNLRERVLPRFEHLHAGDDAHSIIKDRAVPEEPSADTVQTS
jgi:hypothetical protein